MNDPKVTGVTEAMIQADPALFRGACFRLLWLLVMQRGGRAPCARATLASVPKGAMLVMSEHGDGSVVIEAVDNSKRSSSQEDAGGAAFARGAVPPAALSAPASVQSPTSRGPVRDCCEGAPTPVRTAPDDKPFNGTGL